MGTSFKDASGTSGSNKNPGSTIPAGADVVPFRIVPPCCAITGGGVIVVTRVRARKSDSPDLQASRSAERMVLISYSRNCDVERRASSMLAIFFQCPRGRALHAQTCFSLNFTRRPGGGLGGFAQTRRSLFWLRRGHNRHFSHLLLQNGLEPRSNLTNHRFR